MSLSVTPPVTPELVWDGDQFTGRVLIAYGVAGVKVFSIVAHSGATDEQIAWLRLALGILRVEPLREVRAARHGA